MATNDFLPFATGAGANVLSQSDYAALPAVSTGYQSGIAKSQQLNKTWRQSSIMAAVLAQFIADQTGVNSVDDGTTASLLANLKKSNPGRLINVQIFTASGTYTPSAGLTKAIVQVVGGGAGTGGAPTTSASQFSGSPGASSGTYVEVLLTAAQIGASQGVTIGLGGTAGGTGSSSGGTGGTSAFGSLITCPGGLPSTSYGPTAATVYMSNGPSANAVPTASTGTVLALSRGNSGNPVSGSTGNGVIAPLGAASPLDSTQYGPGAGAPGTALGASQSAIAGNVGTAGKVIVWEYA